MSAKYDVAVVGATGAVGETMLEILAERDFPVNNVYPLASARSAGKKIPFEPQGSGRIELANAIASSKAVGSIRPLSPSTSVMSPIGIPVWSETSMAYAV